MPLLFEKIERIQNNPNYTKAMKILFSLAILGLIANLVFVILKPVPTNFQKTTLVENKKDLSLTPSQIDLFKNSRVVMNQEINNNVQETSLNMKLKGTWPSLDRDVLSTAIISINGKQERFALGDVILNNVTLHDVKSDHIYINRGGLIEKLYIDNFKKINPDILKKPEIIPQNVQEYEDNGKRNIEEFLYKNNEYYQLLKQFAFFSVKKETDGNEYFHIYPANGEILPIFTAINLKSGDKILSINGTRLDAKKPNHIEEIFSNINVDDNVNLLIQRDKENISVNLSLNTLMLLSKNEKN